MSQFGNLLQEGGGAERLIDSPGVQRAQDAADGKAWGLEQRGPCDTGAQSH